jgi:hypothetical protein
VVQNENYVFDFAKEIVQDPRYESDISLETIYGFCEVIQAEANVVPSDLLKSKSKIPKFVARYKLERPQNLKRYQIFPIIEKKATKERAGRRTTMGAVDQPRDSELRKTPKLKLVRAQSMETLKATGTPKDFVGKEEWVVKVVENKRNSSYKKKLDDITDALSDVEIVEITGSSPPKKSKMSLATRKSLEVRRNLNASMNDTGDSDVLNYSIVKEDINGNTPDMKIKLRISENQKR